MSENLELCVWVFGELYYLEDLFKEWTYFIDLCHFFFRNHTHFSVTFLYIARHTKAQKL